MRASEARYLGLVESLPAIVYVAAPDPPYSPLYVSPSIETLGYTREEWFQCPDLWISLIHPDDRARILHDTELARAAGKDNDYEYRVFARDGSLRWVHDKGHFLLNDKGRPFCWQGFIMDITSRKDAEKQLAEVHAQVARSNEDLLAILDHLHLGIAMIDREGRVTFLSEFCQALLGKHEMLGRFWHEVCHFDEQAIVQLRAAIDLPEDQRQMVSVRLGNQAAEWAEIDVWDDPRDANRRFFVLNDVTDIYDLRRQLRETTEMRGLTGQSAAMQRVYSEIEELAAVDATVLIEGETGTGKELVARAIHFSGPRRAQPLIAVNCAGLVDSLLLSQLFGHRKGSFTGAGEDRVGLIEAAHKGTLFLDEIGDIPLNVQTQLLRFLQEREITRLGETKPRRVDVRVISATFRDLPTEVLKGAFRQDLLYRIRVARIQLPALRERLEDIPLLAEAFLTEYRQKTGKPVQSLSTSALRLLLNHPWPGNVRELKSAIEVALLRCKGSVLRADDFSELAQGVPPVSHIADKPLSLANVREAVKVAGGNRALAARLLGVSRATLYRRLAASIASD